MRILIMVVAAYVVSFYGAYAYVRKAYSKGGRWQNVDVELEDVVVVFVPILNTVLAIRHVLEYLETNLNKFFGIKK